MDKSKLRKFYRYCWFWLTTIFFLIQVNCLVAQGQIYAFIGRNARNAPPVVYDHEPGRALLNLLGFFVIGPLPLLGVWFFAPLDLFFKPKHFAAARGSSGGASGTPRKNQRMARPSALRLRVDPPIVHPTMGAKAPASFARCENCPIAGLATRFE